MDCGAVIKEIGGGMRLCSQCSDTYSGSGGAVVSAVIAWGVASKSLVYTDMDVLFSLGLGGRKPKGFRRIIE